MQKVVDQLFEELECGKLSKAYCGVILVGHCCSGKTTIAEKLYHKALSKKEYFSKVELWDSDLALLEVACRQGSLARSISELYIQEGATAFRLKESRLILSYLLSLETSASQSSCFTILSLGGGALSYINELAPRRWEELSQPFLKVALQKSGFETYKSHQERWKKNQSRAYLAKPFPSLSLWSSKSAYRSSLALSRADRLALI